MFTRPCPVRSPFVLVLLQLPKHFRWFAARSASFQAATDDSNDDEDHYGASSGGGGWGGGDDDAVVALQVVEDVPHNCHNGKVSEKKHTFSFGRLSGKPTKQK